MDSESLEEHGLKEWLGWDLLTILDVPYKQGVYAIRLKSGTKKRKIGASDLLYIGESNNLVRRIFGNYLGGIGGGAGSTTERINILLQLGENFENTEIGWVVTENDQERESLERKLIERYKYEHGEKPPWSYNKTLEEEIKRLKEIS